MRKASMILALSVVAMVLAAQTAAPAAVTEDFFAGGTGSAKWVHYSPPPPGSMEDFSIALTLRDAADYAGVDLTGVPATAPAASPSFMFRSTVSSANSGGSPRLRIQFSDGGSIDIRPLSWTANVWTMVPTGPNDYDNNGGSCGFLYAPTYATALACHPGASVTGAHIVTDSAWAAGPYTHYIDDIKYGDTTISYPSSCNQDSSGSHENGLVSGPVHDAVEPLVPPARSTIHSINCDIIVPLGL